MGASALVDAGEVGHGGLEVLALVDVGKLGRDGDRGELEVLALIAAGRAAASCSRWRARRSSRSPARRPAHHTPAPSTAKPSSSTHARASPSPGGPAYASRDELCACLDHLLDAAGNPSLMTTELKATLAEHAAGNYRVLMNMADELLAVAVDRELPRLDERLYLDHFQQPARPRPPATRKRDAATAAQTATR